MKKPFILISLVLISLCFISCYKNYSRTIAVCNGNLFVEKYSHNFIDVAYYYLTDSINFRMYVGKFDNEHGGYYLKCQNDSIKITETYEGEILNDRRYSLIDLKKHNNLHP